MAFALSLTNIESLWTSWVGDQHSWECVRKNNFSPWGNKGEY